MDPRWLEILKASGWQLFGLGLALSGFWLLLQLGVLLDVELALIVYGLPLAILICFVLASASVAESIGHKLSIWLAREKAKKLELQKCESAKQAFRDYEPYLTETEWQILAFLYQNKLKTFTASLDADRASTLYSRGFVELLLKPGQQFDVTSCPFGVPDPVWDAMEDMHGRFAAPEVKLGQNNRRPWHSGGW